MWTGYITDFSRVGADEHVIQNEKRVNSQQLKRISKAILRMSIAMGVTGSLGPTGLGAMAQQQCAIVDKDNQDTSWSIFAIVVLVVCMDVLLSKLAFRTWKWVDRKMKTLENIIHGVSGEVEQAPHEFAF